MKFYKNIIAVDRQLSDLDKFTLKFVRILSKHVDYVIVSGYVAILLGRSRASEDVDIIIPKISFNVFKKILKDLKKKGFYCLNAETDKEIFSYWESKFAIRFAEKRTAIPNIELKWAKTKADKIALSTKITVDLGKEKLKISNIELEIAFKEAVLKSQKDMEDARHLRNVKKGLNIKLIKRYKAMLDEIY